MEVEGVPIIRRIYGLFEELFEEIIIVTNQGDSFKNFGAKVFQDLIAGKGALGGLYTGIFFSSFRYSFCVACDMPFISKSLVQYLFDNTEGSDVVVPRTRDGFQPLHAIYSKNCLGAMRKILDEGRYRIVDIYNMVKVRIVDEKDFLSLDPHRESFINVNTPEELISLSRQKKLGLK